MATKAALLALVINFQLVTSQYFDNEILDQEDNSQINNRPVRNPDAPRSTAALAEYSVNSGTQSPGVPLVLSPGLINPGLPSAGGQSITVSSGSSQGVITPGVASSVATSGSQVSSGSPQGIFTFPSSGQGTSFISGSPPGGVSPPISSVSSTGSQPTVFSSGTPQGSVISSVPSGGTSFSSGSPQAVSTGLPTGQATPFIGGSPSSVITPGVSSVPSTGSQPTVFTAGPPQSGVITPGAPPVPITGSQPAFTSGTFPSFNPSAPPVPPTGGQQPLLSGGPPQGFLTGLTPQVQSTGQPAPISPVFLPGVTNIQQPPLGPIPPAVVSQPPPLSATQLPVVATQPPPPPPVTPQPAVITQPSPPPPPQPAIATQAQPQPQPQPATVTQPPPPPAPVATTQAAGAAATGGQIQQCHLRSCDQTITGRRLSYSRALEIVQNEEYLDAADLSIIRRKKRALRRWNKGHKRVKRQGPGTPEVVMPPMETVFNPPPPPSDPVNSSRIIEPVVAVGLIGLLGYALSQIPETTTPPPTTTTTPAPPPPPTQPPIQRFLTNAPLPGTFGGGLLPFGVTPLALEALSLVPPGKQPVSIFPPFVRQRTFNAVGVIFREGESTIFGVTSPRRRSSKSSKPRNSIISKIKNRAKNLTKNFKSTFLRRPRRLTKRDLRTLRKMGRPARHLANRLGSEFKRRMRSMFTKGRRGLKQGRSYFAKSRDSAHHEHQHVNEVSHHHIQQHQQDHVYHQHSQHNQQHHDDDQHYYNQQSGGGQDQIFEDELFGFRIRIRLVEDQPCALDVTCDAAGNKIGFRGKRSPDDYHRYYIPEGYPDPQHYENHHYHHDYSSSIFGGFSNRQTGEEFESDAGAECRVVPNPNGCVPL